MDKWLSHPTALKVLSVIIALLLWAVVHFDPEKTPATVTSNLDTKAYEAQSVIPVGLDEEHYALVKLEPTVVRVVVEGRRANLLGLKDENIVLNVDLSGIKEGEHVLPLTYKLPKGIELVEMSPTTVTVELVEIQTKAFDLGVKIEGTPANGYITGTPNFVTTGGGQVKVTLPKEEMALVGSVSTSISVEGAEKTVEEKKSKIVVYDTEGHPMEHAVINPSTVAVTVPVTPPFKMLPLQLSYAGSLPDGLSVSAVKPEMDKVAVYGDQKLLDSLQFYKGVTLDLSKIKGTGTYKAKVTATDGVKMVEPNEINVEVTVVNSETRTLSRNIQLGGLADGLEATVMAESEGAFAFDVLGAPNVLDALKTDDIQLSADLSGLAPGTHSVELKAVLPRFVQLAGGTLTVNIEIKDNSVSTGTDPTGEPGTPTGPPTETPDGNGTPPPEETANSGNSGGGGNSNTPEDDGHVGPGNSDGSSNNPTNKGA
ncbi:YbbR-like domain-containing protein [Paenibacillus gorillae]|uniref:CdaR family protein n=1 Tax=Paenibacillus gorillae TaxID=1243662 RepID=UPI0004B1B601|nr:CdaR family protein [Paenibacillus gorillae]